MGASRIKQITKNNRYSLYQYDLINNNWNKIKDFPTINLIGDFLKLSYDMTWYIYHGKHILNKFFKIEHINKIIETSDINKDNEDLKNEDKQCVSDNLKLKYIKYIMELNK